MATDFKKILVPLDFSPVSLAALDHAAYIAKTNKGSITLLHVVEKSDNLDKLPTEVELYFKSLEDSIMKKLEDLIAKNKDLEGVKINCIATSGTIHKEIIRIQKKIKCDLVVMGTTGTSNTSIKRLFLGSNAYRVVSESICPVISVRGKKVKKVTYKSLLLPIDPTKDSIKKVNRAIEFAKIFSSKIYVISVSGMFDDYTYDYHKFQERMENVTDKIVKAGIETESSIFRHSNIASCVMEFADEVKADMIMIYADESGVGKYLTGSAARTVIQESLYPVISITENDI